MCVLEYESYIFPEFILINRPYIMSVYRYKPALNLIESCKQIGNMADRKEKIDLSVSLLLFLAAVNVTSFFSLKDNRIVVVMILTVYFLLYAGAKELLRRRAEKKRK